MTWFTICSGPCLRHVRFCRELLRRPAALAPFALLAIMATRSMRCGARRRSSKAHNPPSEKPATENFGGKVRSNAHAH